MESLNPTFGTFKAQTLTHYMRDCCDIWPPDRDERQPRCTNELTSRFESVAEEVQVSASGNCGNGEVGASSRYSGMRHADCLHSV